MWPNKSVQNLFFAEHVRTIVKPPVRTTNIHQSIENFQDSLQLNIFNIKPEHFAEVGRMAAAPSKVQNKTGCQISWHHLLKY